MDYGTRSKRKRDNWIKEFEDFSQQDNWLLL